MRNVRALCGLAVFAAAFGCGGGSDQSGRGAQAPTQATGETPPPEVSQQQQPPMPGEPEMGPPSATQPGQPAPGGGAAQMAPMMNSSDLLMGSFVCMLGPVMLDRRAMGTPGSTTGQGSMGQGSTGQGSSGQGSMGQGSTGQGSMGQGSSGQGSTSGGLGSAAEQCVTIAQATNVMPASLAMGDPSAVDSVRRILDSRLSVEGASQDVSNNTLALYDKGVAAIKEARIADDSLYGAMSSQGVGGGPSSGSGGSGSSKPDTSKQTATTRPGAEEIRAHRALGDLYQFGRNLGATQTGTEAQALAWVIAVERFEGVSDLPSQQKSLAAEPMFAVMLNVPGPTTGRAASNWNEYLSAAARSVGAMSSSGGAAVGGGPAPTGEKANMRQVARGAEERLQVLGQQLPPSSPLRPEIDRAIADLRKIEAQAAQPSTQQQKPSTQPKKPPAQSPQQSPQQNQKKK